MHQSISVKRLTVRKQPHICRIEPDANCVLLSSQGWRSSWHAIHDSSRSTFLQHSSMSLQGYGPPVFRSCIIKVAFFLYSLHVSSRWNLPSIFLSCILRWSSFTTFPSSSSKYRFFFRYSLLHVSSYKVTFHSRLYFMQFKVTFFPNISFMHLRVIFFSHFMNLQWRVFYSRYYLHTSSRWRFFPKFTSRSL